MEALRNALRLVLAPGMPVLFFVCFTLALCWRGRCPAWVPVAASLSEWGVFAYLLVWHSPPGLRAQIGFQFGLYVAVSMICLLVAARGLSSHWRWRTWPLLAGLLVISPVMALAGASSVYLLFR